VTPETGRPRGAASGRGRRLLEHPRYELVPVKGVHAEMAHLPRRETVTVTCSPSRGIESTLRLTESLCEGGFDAVPHVSARLVTDRGHARRIVDRLLELEISDVFVIGGDIARPAGPFASSLSLLRVFRELGYGGSIGVAAYPEAHPLVSDETLWRELAAKQEHAAYMVSQICFDPDRIVAWLDEARRRDLRLPLWVGFPGVVDRNKLMRVALRIGVGDSSRYLTKHGSLVTRLIRPGGYNPEELVCGLVPHVDDATLNIAGYHINTFNQVATTERWRKAVLDSSTQGSGSTAART
jgi:methylenetetrahydrofolate reductase (NADPH)